MKPIPPEKVIQHQPGVYRVNEIFYSLQGEGALVGTPMVFLRFSECNLRCTVSNVGFDCDTEFVSGRMMEVNEILEEIRKVAPAKPHWVLLTGGEPGLQVDNLLIDALHQEGFQVAIETNGTIQLPSGIDWVCVSPKTAEHTIRQRKANEVKYVCPYSKEPPDSVVESEYKFISVPFQADGTVRKEDLEWCLSFVARNPSWRLTIQIHKILRIR